MYEKYGSALPVSWIRVRNQISSANAALDPDQGKPHHANLCGSGTLVWIHAYSNCVFYLTNYVWLPNLDQNSEPSLYPTLNLRQARKLQI